MNTLWDHVILNGTVVAQGTQKKANIYIKEGKIAAISETPLEGNTKETTNHKINL